MLTNCMKICKPIKFAEFLAWQCAWKEFLFHKDVQEVEHSIDVAKTYLESRIRRAMELSNEKNNWISSAYYSGIKKSYRPTYP